MRPITAIMASLAMLAVTLSGPAAATTAMQQGGGATLTIHNRSCPVEFPGPDFYGECHDDPIAGMPFVITGPETREGTTDANGNVTFDGLTPGTYDVTGGPPGEFVRNTVFCAPAATPGTRRPFTQTANVSIELALAAGESVVCDWYSVPENLRGEPLPPPTATPLPTLTLPPTVPPLPTAPLPSETLPAALRAGGCPPAALGERVADFANLTRPGGADEGPEEAIVAATSFSTIALGLDDLLAADHAIVVLSRDGAMVLACGAVGGPRNANGAVVIGLREVGNSGYSGIAYLAPSVTGAGQTAVSLFVARNLGRT